MTDRLNLGRRGPLPCARTGAPEGTDEARVPSFRTHGYDEMVRAMQNVKRRLWSSPETSCLELCAPKRGRTHSVTTEGLVQLERESS